MSWDLNEPCPKCGVRVDPDMHDCPVYECEEE